MLLIEENFIIEEMNIKIKHRIEINMKKKKHIFLFVRSKQEFIIKKPNRID